MQRDDDGRCGDDSHRLRRPREQDRSRLRPGVGQFGRFELIFWAECDGIQVVEALKRCSQPQAHWNRAFFLMLFNLFTCVFHDLRLADDAVRARLGRLRGETAGGDDPVDAARASEAMRSVESWPGALEDHAERMPECRLDGAVSMRSRSLPMIWTRKHLEAL